MNYTSNTRWKTRKEVKSIEIAYSAFGELMATVGTLPPETGGLLLGSREDNIVRKFVFDKWGSRSHISYDPDPSKLNSILKHEWRENRLALIGWAHSHPTGASRMSGDYGGNTGDVGFLRAIFEAMPSIETFVVPILFSGVGGAQTIHPYIVERGSIEHYKMGMFRPVPDESIPDPWSFETKEPAKAENPASHEGVDGKKESANAE